MVVTVSGMAYPSDLADEQWALLEPVFNAPGKPGRKHVDDLRLVVDAMLYIAHGQPVAVPTRVFRALDPGVATVPSLVGQRDLGAGADRVTRCGPAGRGRAEETPSMLVIDTHLARGASNGGATFHDRGGPFGRTKRAKTGRRR